MVIGQFLEQIALVLGKGTNIDPAPQCQVTEVRPDQRVLALAGQFDRHSAAQHGLAAFDMDARRPLRAITGARRLDVDLASGGFLTDGSREEHGRLYVSIFQHRGVAFHLRRMLLGNHCVACTNKIVRGLLRRDGKVV